MYEWLVGIDANCFTVLLLTEHDSNEARGIKKFGGRDNSVKFIQEAAAVPYG